MKTNRLYMGSLLLCGLLTPILLAAQPPAVANELAVYKTRDKFTRCPAGVHPKIGCVLLTGKAIGAFEWTNLNRIAIVDGPSPNIPAGCVVATSSGTLSGKRGVIHFKADGYYCPKTDTAYYHYDFDASEAARFRLSEYGTISYVGRNKTETFSTSTSSAH